MLKNVGVPFQLFTLFTGKSAFTSHSPLLHNPTSHEFKRCPKPHSSPNSTHENVVVHFIHLSWFTCTYKLWSRGCIYIYMCIYELTWFSTLQMQPRPLWDTFLLFPFCLRRARFCHSFLGKEQPLRLHAKWWMCKAEESGNSRSAPGHHASCNHLATTWLTQLRSISLTPSPAAQRVTPSPFHPWCLTRTLQYLETSADRTAISSPEKSHLTD